MTKSTKIIAALGVAAGLGIAALPAGAIFADNTLIPLNFDKGDYGVTTNVKVNVTESIAVATEKTDCEGKNASNTDLKISDTGTCKEVVAAATNSAKGFEMKVSLNDGETSYLALNHTQQTEDSAKIASVDGEAVSTSKPGWNITGGALTNNAPGAFGSGVTVMKTNAAKHVETDMTYNFATRADQQAGTYSTQILYTAAINDAAPAEEAGTTGARVIVSTPAQAPASGD